MFSFLPTRLITASGPQKTLRPSLRLLVPSCDAVLIWGHPPYIVATMSEAKVSVKQAQRHRQ